MVISVGRCGWQCTAASVASSALAAPIAVAAATEPAAVAAASVVERGDRRSALGCQNALKGADYALPNAL